MSSETFEVLFYIMSFALIAGIIWFCIWFSDVIKAWGWKDSNEVVLIGHYWVDENDNRWDIRIYTEEQAEKASNSLVNCYNCRNCINCRCCDNCCCC